VALSNGLYLEVIDTTPLQNVGWEVQVVSTADFGKLCTGQSYAPLTIISRFVEVTISPEISGLGAGSITLDLDDDLWTHDLTDGSPARTLLEYEHLWQVYQNGALRWAFLGQSIEDTVLPSDEGQMRAVVISGKGPGDVLRDGRVMTPYYPYAAPLNSTDPSFYEFRRITVMGAWLYLLAEARKRGTLQFICHSFDRDRDTGGEEWEDKPLPIPDPTYVTDVLQADVNFFPDSYDLSDAAEAKLAGICGEFNHMPAPQLTIVGHTDSTNTHAYNQTLSENRANAVANFIRGIVPQVVMNVSGRGETQPIATNATARGREYNRRVTLRYPTGPKPPVEPYIDMSGMLGINLLDLLEEWTGGDVDQPAPIRAEWMMRPNFVLDIRRLFGQRRDRQVVFYEGSLATVSKQRSRQRSDIANLIAVQDTLGNYAIVGDTASKARWRQREHYSRPTGTFSPESLTAIAQTIMYRDKDERATWTIKVAPDAEGRRVFEDYNLGDWVGISRYLGGQPNLVERFRVMAISLRVDADNNEDLELSLQTNAEFYLQRLRMRLTSILNHKTGVEVFVQDVAPPNAKVGDLWTLAADDMYA